MIESLIFLFLAAGWMVTTFYVIDLQTDKANLEAELKTTFEYAEHWRSIAANAVFKANDLGDEDRDQPLDCYQLHAALYGEKENA